MWLWAFRITVSLSLAAILLTLTSYAAAAASAQAMPGTEPAEFYSGDPRLQDYLREALDRNPSIREALARYQAAVARLPQAGSLPDPQLSLTQYLRRPETRVGPQTTMLSVSQLIPWFGKLGDKEKVAAKEAAVQKELLAARRAEVARQVKLAYYDLAYIDNAINIAEEDLSVLWFYETMA